MSEREQKEWKKTQMKRESYGTVLFDVEKTLDTRARANTKQTNKQTTAMATRRRMNKKTATTKCANWNQQHECVCVCGVAGNVRTNLAH